VLASEQATRVVTAERPHRTYIAEQSEKLPNDTTHPMIKAQKSEIPTQLPTSWSDTLALEDPLLVWLTLHRPCD